MDDVTTLGVLSDKGSPSGAFSAPSAGAAIAEETEAAPASCSTPGFVNAAGQWRWTKARQFAPAPAVTPFYYLMLVWAPGFGYLLWGDVPTLSLLSGSGIVVGTGLFLFLREARLQRSAAGAR